jgi:hypothetical protein
MATAPRTHPELIGRPGHAGLWIAQIHHLAAAHAADLNPELIHAWIL